MRGSPERSRAPSSTSSTSGTLTPSEQPVHGLSTRAVHPPKPPLQDGAPVAPALDPSVTYSFEDTATFAKASEVKVGAGYVYTRWANPTIDAFEAAVADLEGADDAEAFATGMAAISAIFLGLCEAGDRVVATRQLYGNTYSLLADRLPRYGITSDLFDIGDLDGIEGALAGARLLYCETIGNPRVQVADVPALAELAAAARIPLVVDNTFASPILFRPLEHGAEIVVHSATKFLGGHHDLMGGVVCSDPGTMAEIRAVARDLGPTMSPFNAWLGLRGMKTLPIRVERVCATALAVAEALAAHPAVEAVHYPALGSSPDRRLAHSLFGGRGGGTLAFDVAGGRDRAATFQQRLRLIKRAASLGGTDTLLVHAASITHTQLAPEKLAAAGIGEGLCRLSIGLEDPDDLIADLDAALGAAD